MNFLDTAHHRKFLFGLLYLSEGAPIGFIWLGLPTRLRALDVPLDRITWLMALLILPWTLKFLWAPLIDLVQGPRWGRKHWIIASQSIMAITLLPLLWLDLQTDFATIAGCLLAHAIAAATQDVAIDALCIAQSSPEERGALNGWMQCGVLVGRALMGGGSLMMERWIGFSGVVMVLIGLVSFSMVLLMFAREKPSGSDENSQISFSVQLMGMMRELWIATRTGRIWMGFLFALSVPAAFKSFEAIVGPFLIDRGYSEFDIGRFTSTAMIGGMIVGSLLAGRCSRIIKDVRFLILAVVVNLLAITGLAVGDLVAGKTGGIHVLVLVTIVSVSIGWFTVAMYNWLMNLTDVSLAATQFTAFMAASNACEAWSTSMIGQLQASFGYPVAILCLCGFSALAASLVLWMVTRHPLADDQLRKVESAVTPMGG